MSTHENLKAMRELLATPDRWTRSFEARDSNGIECMYCDPDAVCWCLSGAMLKVISFNNIAPWRPGGRFVV